MAEGLQRNKLMCRPTISGPMWWYTPKESAAWGVKGWGGELDRESRIGFDFLWLANVTSALASKEDVSVLAILLDLCARRGVRVILSTGASAGWYRALNLEEELGTCSDNIARIGERFRGHPAFSGWYLPHEIYMFWGEPAAYIQALYSVLAERCRKAAALPVAVSPFFNLDRDKVFGDLRYCEPDEYRQYWAGLLRNSGIDTVILQDSGQHFSYVTNEMRRPFFAAMRESCAAAGAAFWANAETAEFECSSKEEYVRRYGKVHPSTIRNAPWRPTPIPRLRKKLALASEYCEKILTWGYWEYCRPSLGEAAQEWYRGYKAYYDGIRSARQYERRFIRSLRPRGGCL